MDMNAKLEPQHRWLSRLLGEWTFEAEGQGPPGEPAMKSTGTERVRPLGDLWVLCEGSGEMPGGPAHATLLTLGYDPQKKHFVGTWIGSMMTTLWVYQGSLDAEQTTLTLETEGPDFTGADRTARYRERIEFRSDDHRIFSSSAEGADGQWHTFMTAHYRRAR